MIPEEFVQEMAWERALLIALLELAVLILAGYLGLVIRFYLRGEVSFGLVCTFSLVFCLPFGVLLALLIGWLRAGRWQMRAFMALWTGLVFLACLNFAALSVLSSLDAATLRWLFGSGGPLGGGP